MEISLKQIIIVDDNGNRESAAKLPKTYDFRGDISHVVLLKSAVDALSRAVRTCEGRGAFMLKSPADAVLTPDTEIYRVPRE